MGLVEESDVDSYKKKLGINKDTNLDEKDVDEIVDEDSNQHISKKTKGNSMVIVI